MCSRMACAIRCNFCKLKYDEKRKPFLGSCSHLICGSCKNWPSLPHCPICNQEDAFKEASTNYAAWELAKQLKTNCNCDLKLEFDPSEEDFKTGNCSECNDATQNLRLCTECAENDGLIRKFENTWIIETKIGGEFLKIKETAICPNCALDGAHSGHRIEKFFDALKMDCEVRKKGRETKENSFFMQLKKHLEEQLLRTEMSKDKIMEPSCLENAFTEIPEIQKIIEEVRSRHRRESIWTHKLFERDQLLGKEAINLLFDLFKCWTSSPFVDFELTAAELEELEVLRTKLEVPLKYLKGSDVQKIDELIQQNMKVELLQGSDDEMRKRFEEAQVKVLKARMAHFKVMEKRGTIGSDTPNEKKLRIYLMHLHTGIKWNEAQIERVLAGQKGLMKNLMDFTRCLDHLRAVKNLYMKEDPINGITLSMGLLSLIMA